ncbi:MAG: hypothetical protein PVG20_02515 [Thioalkalispiraceae bacterium]|jgi:hypothetical protein
MNKSLFQIRNLFLTTLIMTLVACGGGGSGSGGNPPAGGTGNTLPTVNAGTDQLVTEGDSVQLSGTGTDAEGTVTFSWHQDSGSPVSLSDPAVSDPTFVAPQVMSQQSLQFTLTVTDSDGATSTDTVTITVADSQVTNNPPTANAGPDQTVVEGSTVQFAGSGSDIEGAVTFSWTQDSGLPVSLSDPAIANPMFVAPQVSANETLQFTLTVTDSDGVSATDSVTIIVTDAQAISQRVRTIEYDYDNNGVPDVVSEFVYDGSGRTTTITNTYTDDGVVDLFNILGQDIDQQVITLGYDTNDRLTSVAFDDTNEHIKLIYTYTNDLLTHTDYNTYDAMGNLIDSVYFTYSYGGTLMTAWNLYQTPSNQLFASRSFHYTPALLPDIDIYTAGGTPEKITYSWRADGQLDLRESDYGNDGSVETVFDAQYDAQDRLISEVRTSSYADASINLTVSRVYDSNGLPGQESYDLAPEDMVTDATMTPALEEGPCIDAYAWLPGALPNFVKQAGLPYIPGTGFFQISRCFH